MSLLKKYTTPHYEETPEISVEQISLEEELVMANSEIINNNINEHDRILNTANELAMQNEVMQEIVNKDGSLTSETAAGFEAARRSSAIALGLNPNTDGQSVVDPVGLESISNGIISLEDDNKGMIRKAWEAIKKFFVDLWNKIVEYAKRFWKWMMGLFGRNKKAEKVLEKASPPVIAAANCAAVHVDNISKDEKVVEEGIKEVTTLIEEIKQETKEGNEEKIVEKIKKVVKSTEKKIGVPVKAFDELGANIERAVNTLPTVIDKHVKQKDAKKFVKAKVVGTKLDGSKNDGATDLAILSKDKEMLSKPTRQYIKCATRALSSIVEAVKRIKDLDKRGALIAPFFDGQLERNYDQFNKLTQKVLSLSDYEKTVQVVKEVKTAKGNDLSITDIKNGTNTIYFEVGAHTFGMDEQAERFDNQDYKMQKPDIYYDHGKIMKWMKSWRDKGEKSIGEQFKRVNINDLFKKAEEAELKAAEKYGRPETKDYETIIRKNMSGYTFCYNNLLRLNGNCASFWHRQMDDLAKIAEYLQSGGRDINAEKEELDGVENV